jgi:hypothetical protein
MHTQINFNNKEPGRELMSSKKLSLLHRLPDLDVYWVGGAPCSGKSSIAEKLAFKYCLSLIKSDDSMFRHMQEADPLKQPVMHKLAGLSWNELWLRPLEIQVADEFGFFREEFDLLLDEMASFPKDRPILTEGNAWPPELLSQLQVNPGRVIYLIPTREFQVSYYSKREFTKGILAQCDDPQAAFANWMERDACFTVQVLQQAHALGLPVIQVDGSTSLDENMLRVEHTLLVNFLNSSDV